MPILRHISEKAMAPHSSTLAWKNPMDGGGWWAAVHGVAEGWTRLERLHFHFSLSCIGEGNGSPLQCSCLENPRNSGAWWAAVYGVAQSQTRLKQLSNSSTHMVNTRQTYRETSCIRLTNHLTHEIIQYKARYLFNTPRIQWKPKTKMNMTINNYAFYNTSS